MRYKQLLTTNVPFEAVPDGYVAASVFVGLRAGKDGRDV